MHSSPFSEDTNWRTCKYKDSTPVGEKHKTFNALFDLDVLDFLNY